MQPFYSKILTVNGWKTIDEIQVNDSIIDVNNNFVKVISNTFKEKTDIYRIIFADKTCVDCCSEQRWKIKTENERFAKKDWKTVTIKEIIQYIEKQKTKLHQRKLSILAANSIEFPSKEISLEPYLFGVLLGDGGWTSETVTITTADKEILEKINILLPKQTKLIKINGNKYDYRISRTETEIERSQKIHRYNLISPNNEIVPIFSVTDFAQKYKFNINSLYKLFNGKIQSYKKWKFHSKMNYNNNLIKKNPIKNILFDLGLYKCYSYEKFVPNIYKYNSIETRIKLLQGLMDTDGAVSKDGYGVIFYSTSIILANDVKEIVNSLGGKAAIYPKQTFFTYKGVKKRGRPSFIVNISLPSNIIPFTLSRKLNRFKPRTKYPPIRLIEKIEYIGKEKARQILTDSSDHLYITNDYIVTQDIFNQPKIQ